MHNRIFLLFFAFIHTGFLFSQDPVERNLASFNKLSVDDRIIVRLVKSDHETASIKAQGIDVEAVKTEVTNSKLSIYVSGNLFAQKKVIVTLGYKVIKSIEVINGADVTTTSLMVTDTLTVVLKTGGMLYLDADIRLLKSNVIEGSLLTAEGYATIQDIYVATSATVSAYDLESEMITVRTATGGKAKIFVENELNATAGSKGYISYKGNPLKKNLETRSGGTIETYAE